MPFLNRGMGGLMGGGAVAAGWWVVAGKTCVAAYQPKGAADLAASYVNLANPGTYNAAAGTAPSFGANGWTFNGSSQYLTTGITPSSTSWSALVRFSSVGNTGVLFGSYNSTVGSVRLFNVTPAGGGTRYYALGLTFTGVSGDVTSGVMGFGGLTAYLNGNSEGAIGGAATGSFLPIVIGARNVDSVVTNYGAAIISAFAIYSDTLTASEMATVSAAMAAL